MLYKERGALYRMDTDSQIYKLDENITLSNGLAWDDDAKTLYYVDSLDSIRKYDYDIETGNICEFLRYPTFLTKGIGYSL